MPAVAAPASPARKHRNISGTPLEAELLSAAQAGDLAARNQLIEHYVPFLRYIVGRIVPKDEVDEFISIAVEAMIRGIELYDRSHGVRLITYIGNGVRQRVAASWKEWGVIRVPRTILTDENLARAETARRVGTLVGPGPGRWHDPDPAEAEDRQREAARLHAAIESLEPREREVIVSRSLGVTLKEVGAVLGVSRERVRQIEGSAMARLREFMGATQGGAA